LMAWSLTRSAPTPYESTQPLLVITPGLFALELMSGNVLGAGRERIDQRPRGRRGGGATAAYGFQSV